MGVRRRPRIPARRVAFEVDGEPAYLPIWGHDREEEKAAFEAFIDLFIDRLDGHPDMHVYHYGGYESGAVKRLMQRHATREDEVDRLLRGGVFVDLLNVVRQGVRASVESYSLKQIEKFYLPQREGPVTEAGFSVVEYERWMAERDDSILKGIADYNRDDCVSTLMLRTWLEDRRAEAVDRFAEAVWDRPAVRDGAPTEGQTARAAEVQERIDALTAGVPADRDLRSPEEHGRWLLAQVLDWHRRDEKPAWWLWHDLRQKSTEDLIEASEGLGGLSFVGDVGTAARSVVRRYAFPPQDHKFRRGHAVIDPNPPDGSDFGIGRWRHRRYRRCPRHDRSQARPLDARVSPDIAHPHKADRCRSDALRAASDRGSCHRQRHRGRRTIPSRTRPAHSPTATNRRRRGGNTVGR